MAELEDELLAGANWSCHRRVSHFDVVEDEEGSRSAPLAVRRNSDIRADTKS